jgi:protein-tyrosine-phosphatase
MPRLPASVLFVCNLNRVRSPMAAGLMRRLYGQSVDAQSCGLEPSDEIDPLVVAVMQEVGVELGDHLPRAIDNLSPSGFEVIVALSNEAWPSVEAAGAKGQAEVACWPTEDPTHTEGSRDVRLDAYRQTRRTLEARIVDRFGLPSEGE